MNSNEVFAVIMGRFQPFHEGHRDTFQQVSESFENIIVLVGERQKDDPLTYEQRANFFRIFLKDAFKKIVVMPMYDYDDWEEWAGEVKQSASVISDNLILIKPKKNKDIGVNGYHYLDYLDPWFPDSMNINISNHDIHATMIREQPDKYMQLVPSILRPYLIHKVGKPYDDAEVVDLHSESKWVQLKQHNRKGGTPFIFSERRNKDSIAFIIKNTDTNRIGLLIEQKPPVDVVDVISAFGGSFDMPNDNPYRIVKQEVLEEAGITDFWPVYKGSYMASTQSSEVVHLFLIETKQEEMNPQTTDIGEQFNRCIWLGEDEAKSIPDWRISIMLNS